MRRALAGAALVVSTLVADPGLADVSNVPRLLCWAVSMAGVAVFVFRQETPSPLSQGWRYIHKPFCLPYLMLLLFAGWQFLSVAWAVNRAEALFAASRWILFAFTVGAAYRLTAHSPLRTVVFLSRVSAFLALLALIPAVWQLLSLPDFSWSNRYAVVSLFTHKGTFAMLLMLLAVFPAMRLSIPLHRGRRLYAAVLAVLGLAEAFLLARAVLLALVVGTAAGLVFCLVRRHVRPATSIGKETLTAVVVAALLAAVTVGSAAWMARGPVEPTGEQEGMRSTVSLCERRGLWRMTLRLAGEHPVVGCGAGNWKVCHPSVSIKEVFSMDVLDFHFVRPHNEYLNILSETGLVGLLLFLLASAGLAVRLVRPSRSGRRMVPVAFSALATVAVFSFFDFPFDRTELFLWVSVVVGVTAGLHTPQRPLPTRHWGSWQTILILSVALLAGVRWHCDRCYRDMMHGVHAMLWPQVEHLAHKAQLPLFGSAALGPDGVPYAYYEAMACEYQNKPALPAFRRSLHDSPYDKQVLNDVARLLYTENHATDSSIALLRKAIHISPAYSRSYFNLAQVYLSEDRPGQAIEVLSSFDLGNKRARIERDIWNYLSVDDATYYFTSLLPAEERMRARLLSHAEAREDSAQHFVGGHLASDGAEMVEGVAQVDSQ